MGNPETDPIRIIAKMRETQPGPVVKMPGELVDALLEKFGLKSREILVFADAINTQAIPEIPAEVSLTASIFYDDDIDEGLMNMMYEAGRGEAGKKGVRQMPTEKILAEVSDDGSKRTAQP